MTAPVLQMVPPLEARAAYPLIRARLEQLSKGEAWMPEDVYRDLCIGNAYLWRTPDLDGFLVLQISDTPATKDLHIWIAHNSSSGTVPEFMDQLRRIARDHHCTRITFESPRRGWLRVLPAMERRFFFTEKIE